MAGIRMENKIYEVGMYCRLSKDDGTDNESASIATQKSILTDYVKKQGWKLLSWTPSHIVGSTCLSIIHHYRVIVSRTGER